MPKIVKPLSRWFPVPDDPYQGKLHVRHLKKAEVQGIVQQGIDIRRIDQGVVDAEGQRSVETKIIPASLFETADTLAVAAVVGWENFLDEQEQPLACTPENIKLFTREDGFAAFLTSCREILAKEAAETEEAARKNLKALGSGSPE